MTAGIARTAKVVREVAWATLPFLDYFASLKLALRPRAMISPDFPIHLSMHTEITSTDVVLELGANVGGNSKELARLAKQVYSFEPAPSCYKWLARNMRGASNVKCFNAAVSGRSQAKQEFNVQFGSGSLFNHDVFNWKAHIEVRVVGINDLPFQFNTIISDAEGAEVPIFEAFRGWEKVDKIYCETHWIGGRDTKPRILEIFRQRFPLVWTDLDPSRRFDWVIAKRAPLPC